MLIICLEKYFFGAPMFEKERNDGFEIRRQAVDMKQRHGVIFRMILALNNVSTFSCFNGNI